MQKATTLEDAGKGTQEEEEAEEIAEEEERKEKLVNSGILNLSSTHINDDSLYVLSKGLGYVPKADPPSHSETQIEVNCFYSHIRKIATGRYRIWNKHPLAKKKYITPAPRTNNRFVEEYVQAVQEELQKFYETPAKTDIKHWELNTIQGLARNKNIVIKPADKEQLIVIQDRETYIKSGLDHLSDTNTYEALEEDYSQALAAHISEYVDYLVKINIVDQETAGYFKPDLKHVRTQRIYFLPKTHKKQVTIPIRTIVSGCSGPNENVSKFISYLINPIAQRVQSYVRTQRTLCKS